MGAETETFQVELVTPLVLTAAGEVFEHLWLLGEGEFFYRMQDVLITEATVMGTTTASPGDHVTFHKRISETFALL